MRFTFQSGSAPDPIPTVRAAADHGATLAGEQILTTARHRAPIEEGTLERSGAVSAPHDGTVTIHFDTPYAVRQHEELGYRHDDGRQAKYLETAMHDDADVALRLAAHAIRTALGT